MDPAGNSQVGPDWAATVDKGVARIPNRMIMVRLERSKRLDLKTGR
jgi:hypothetical protein